MIVSLAVTSCGSSDTKTPGGTTCPAQDVDCFLDHLEVAQNGTLLDLVTVSAAQLETGPAPEVFWLADNSTDVYGFDGFGWSVVAKAGSSAIGLSTSSTGDTWALLPDLRKWNATTRTFDPVACPPSGKTGQSLYALPDAVLIGGGDTSYPTVYRYDANGCTGGKIDSVLTGSIRTLYSDGTDIWAIDMFGTWRFHNGAWARFTPGDTPPCCWSEVWGSSGSDVWLAGGTLRHWTGSSFQPDDNSLGAMVWSISGTGPSNIWASATGIAHNAGSGWSYNSTQISGDVWVGSPSDVWVVKSPTSYHWDGSSWTTVPVPGAPPTSNLNRPRVLSGRHVRDGALQQAPTLSVSPASVTLAPGERAMIELAWTDPNGALPTFCFMTCSKTARCSSHAKCTHGFRDGLKFGSSVYQIGYTAVAADPAGDPIDVPIRAMSFPDGTDPAAALAANDTSHGPIIKTPPVHLQQMIGGLPQTGSNGGTCSGCVQGQSCSYCKSGQIMCGGTCCYSNSCNEPCYQTPTCQMPTGCGIQGPYLQQPCSASTQTHCSDGVNCCPSCFTCGANYTCAIPTK